MLSLKEYIKNPRLIFLGILRKTARLYPDVFFVKVQYYLTTGEKLNLKNPQTFNEKLQWLKLYDRRPEYTTMADKILAKEYVAKIIGDEYIVPTYGIWNKFEEIDFNKLPNQFVLKPNHSGGNSGVVICKNKSNLNISNVQKKINKLLKTNLYYKTREWPYKNIEPKILAEQLLDDGNEGGVWDYKFYCFNGKPKLMLIATERNSGNTKFNYFDMDFNPLDFQQGGERSEVTFKKPECFDLMIEFSEKLSKNIPHLRVDFYYVNNKIYFSELTFFDSSGFATFEPEEWNYKLGSYIDLPINTNCSFEQI